MRLVVASLAVFGSMLVLAGCGDKRDFGTTPTHVGSELSRGLSSVGARLQKVNDGIVEALGSEMGSEGPAALSFDWFSERLREIRSGYADNRSVNEIEWRSEK